MDGISAGRLDRTVGESAQSILRINRPTDLVEPARSDKNIEDARDISRIQETEQSDNKPAEDRQKPGVAYAEIESLSDDLNRVFEKSTGIRFQLSEDSGELVVQVVDLQSEEVIRSIPSDRVAELKRNFQEFGGGQNAGVLIDQRV